MKLNLGTKLASLNSLEKGVDSNMAKNVYSSETYGNRKPTTNPDEIFRKGSTKVKFEITLKCY